MGHLSDEPKYACAQYYNLSHSPPDDSAQHEARVGTICSACEIADSFPAVEGGLGGAGLLEMTITLYAMADVRRRGGIGEDESVSSAPATSHSLPVHRGLRGELRGGRGETVYVNMKGGGDASEVQERLGHSIRLWWAPCIRDGGQLLLVGYG